VEPWDGQQRKVKMNSLIFINVKDIEKAILNEWPLEYKLDPVNPIRAIDVTRNGFNVLLNILPDVIDITCKVGPEL